ASALEDAFMPWSKRSFARCTCGSIDVIVLSAMPGQAVPSSTGRENCSEPLIEARYCMAAAASVGESDARVTRRPDDSCSWICCMRARFACKLARVRLLIVDSVTRKAELMAREPR